MSSRTTFFAQPRLVGKQIGDIFRLLSDVGSLIFAILVHELKFFKGFDNVDVVSEVNDDVFGTRV